MPSFAAPSAAVAPPVPVHHFAALDALRGVAALIVVMFHFHVSGAIAQLAIVRHGWLLVDFFFVLSGFVLSHAYGDALAQRREPVLSFMARRLGRVYPLHLVMLLLFVALELLLSSGQFGAVSHRQPFTGTRSATAIISNLALLHSFGVESRLTWNIPSWSIAAEVWTYLVFALVLAHAGRRGRAVMVGLALLAAAALIRWSPFTLYTSFAMGFVRCLYGFGLGIGAHMLHRRWPVGAAGGVLEWIVAAAALSFIGWAPHGPVIMLAPVTFAGLVWVFAADRGWLSRALHARWCAATGLVSYSIYMTHGFVQGRINDAITLLGPRSGMVIAHGALATSDGVGDRIVGAPWLGDALMIGMLALVIAVSHASYRLIEAPGRAAARRWVDPGAA